jgi:hypothetical protein
VVVDAGVKISDLQASGIRSYVVRLAAVQPLIDWLKSACPKTLA